MKQLFFLLTLTCFFACKDSVQEKTDRTTIFENEHQEMIQTLKNLDAQADPLLHYHMNKRLANHYVKEIQTGDPKRRMYNWMQFCSELLRSGNYNQCIFEIEKALGQNKSNYEDLIADNSLPVVELLALAHLRKGEIENCLNNHNEHSCIVPLREEAFHLAQEGSEKAIEIYQKIYAQYPLDKYKWLLNIAHMTLGQYPDEVPESYYIPYPNPKMEDSNFPVFKEVAMDLGIAVDGLSGGVCFEDFNNDGLIDLFATSYGMLDQCQLFINTGKGFENMTKKAGLTGISSGLNTLHVDYDNDGFKDILVLRGAWLGKGGNHPNSLLRNMGDGTFRDVSRSSGILSYHPSQSAAWADINQDGHIDLFIGNESNQAGAHRCELYVNNGDGTFAESAGKHNLGDVQGFVKGVSFGDINNDQWPDLYISLLGGNNMLLLNEEGQFRDISVQAAVEAPFYSFPCWFWDVNNDGYDDIFVSSYDTRSLRDVPAVFSKELQGKEVEADKSKLYINNGDATFYDASKDYQVDKSLFTMGSNFGDLDNDGWLDFYVGTGAPEFNSIIPNRMFRNQEGKRFSEVTAAGRFGHIQKGHGVGFADFDNDGDQDIYAVMGGAFEGDNFTNVCFQNPSATNNWIVLDLEGRQSNRSAIGSRVEVTLEGGRKIYHRVGTGGSFGANSLQCEIGLGKASRIEKIVVDWGPSSTQEWQGLEVNSKYHIVEGSAPVKVNYEVLEFEMGEHEHNHHH